MESFELHLLQVDALRESPGMVHSWLQTSPLSNSIRLLHLLVCFSKVSADIAHHHR